MKKDKILTSINYVFDYYGVNRKERTSKNRHSPIPDAKAVASYLIDKCITISPDKLKEYYNFNQVGAVTYQLRRIKERLEIEKDLFEDIKILKPIIHSILDPGYVQTLNITSIEILKSTKLSLIKMKKEVTRTLELTQNSIESRLQIIDNYLQVIE